MQQQPWWHTARQHQTSGECFPADRGHGVVALLPLEPMPFDQEERTGEESEDLVLLSSQSLNAG